MTVEYQHGRRAQLFVYHDGKLHETVALEPFSTKVELHGMMANKGFVKKGEKEIKKMKIRKHNEARIGFKRQRDANVKRQQRRQELIKERADKERQERRETALNPAPPIAESDDYVQSQDPESSTVSASNNDTEPSVPIFPKMHTVRSLTEAERLYVEETRRLMEVTAARKEKTSIISPPPATGALGEQDALTVATPVLHVEL